jgi:hypothetical protein
VRVHLLTGRRPGVTRLLAVASALAAATSYPLWSNSVTAEVYTLAAVLSGFAVYWLIAFTQTGAVWRLYAACAMWACGFGNHLTIVGILPAAVVYGVVKDRSVLRPRVALTAACIGILGVLQYGFIPTIQVPVPRRERTRSWACSTSSRRCVGRGSAQSAVAAIGQAMLLDGLAHSHGHDFDRAGRFRDRLGHQAAERRVLLIFMPPPARSA